MVNKLPLFYFPPTICWVDDDPLFLNAAESVFKENYNCMLFENPENALRFLASYQLPYSNNFTREFTESDIFDTHNRLPIDINFSQIAQLHEVKDRGDEIALLIIDNNMPNLNGLEICHRLKNSPYKKILLTGETRPNAVIDAFNEGIIDKFIAKDKNLAHTLQKTIYELTSQYFYEKTKNLISHLEACRPSPLSDECFVDFFCNWCLSNNVKEFYLINRYGSFFVKHADNTLTYFIVMSESAINAFLSVNDDAFGKIGELLVQVSNGECIPFFGLGKESWEFDFKDWHQHFYPTQTIQGREKYYWTTVNK